MDISAPLNRINNNKGTLDDILVILHACNDLKIPEMSFNLRRACCDFIMRRYLDFSARYTLESKDIKSIYNQCSFLLKDSKMMNKYGISDEKRALFDAILGGRPT